MSNDDFQDAMAAADKVLASRSAGNDPSERTASIATIIVASLSQLRYAIYKNPEDLEEAIVRARDHDRIALSEDVNHSTIYSLEALKERRFAEFGIGNIPQRAHSIYPGVVDTPPFSDLAVTLAEESSVGMLSMTLKDKLRHFDALRSIEYNTEGIADSEAVKYCRLLLAMLHPTDPLASSAAITLGKVLFDTYSRTDDPEYLDASITVQRDILKIPGRESLSAIFGLIHSLGLRSFRSDDRKDFDKMMRLFPIAATHPIKNVPDRLRISCLWARTARVYGHSSTSTAYQNVISLRLMHDSLAFAPTLEIQHFRLIAMRDYYEQPPLDYASYQVHTGQLTQAIETLERGRGLLWSELRGLRTSTDLVRKVDSQLADKFAAINRDLEALTISGSTGIGIHQRTVDSDEGMDPFGRFVVKQRELTKTRDELICQIRALPGLEGFLKAPSFLTLNSAATHGPVIIINHCEWRSDIIILLHNLPPSLISTTDDFYDRANGLRDQLLVARKKGLDSKEYNRTLSSILENLYDLVGRPVLKRFRELNIPEQSRVWWCPTSVFCSLPLHAMGPIPSDCHNKLYFSDLYIPSYTPTLSALIESRRPGTKTSEKPSILLVVQPDAQIPSALKEMRVIQATTSSVTTLLRDKAKPTSTLEHLRSHRFAHFSCHGILEKGKPFDASFKLYEGARLTLLDLVRSQLPTAEFAFLSACHTAELTEESIADEGLHLTAAVQYCGFRSVVGTMWEMADIDGPDLAGNFYRSVFSDRRTGLPYYERTAEALRDAVQILRRKRNMTLERWVNFVHYGA